MAKSLRNFSTQATEVKKLIIFSSFFYHNFEDTVTKDMLRKESFCGTNPYSEMKIIFKSVVICFQL